jgi:catechol 2,3-dioxygenase-like lactoylglutathione lyase family enzyme
MVNGFLTILTRSTTDHTLRNIEAAAAAAFSCPRNRLFSWWRCSMLAVARLQTIVCTTDLAAADEFYGHVLGLERKDRSEGASVYDVGGADLRVSPVLRFVPSEHTVAGFSVRDLAATMAQLSARGVKWVRFSGFPHDASGAITTPGGARVAWMQDPDGNLLSIVQYA